ncbi:Dioxygenase [Phytophthora infestans]|uniref:Dioxygenase n=1 Tax=Phytophthora infestans TaxID=4787 RepID=A0A833TBU9_PHYIN|nr:Dioxygenase [Phytophthora infestans]KAF4130454.1 Dioxygenase [Phytophthora infestans]
MVKVLTVLAAAVLVSCTLSSSVSAHEHPAGRALSTSQRKLFTENAQAALAKCSKLESTRALQERAVARRTEVVEKHRQDRRQRRLDVTTVLETSHKSSLLGITTTTSASVLFGSTPPCVAEPEVTEGPYYVKGEYIRTDMREQQTGVTMYVDVQVIDINTCDPVKDMYIDLWHTNATGVYSGVVASTNGNNADKTNLQNTFLRGVTPTDKDGVTQMTSIFPGHYAGRTTHVHFIGNYGGSVLSNKTYSGGSVAHVGQFFFDQDLISSVEAVEPYSTNKQSTTLNSRDNIFKEASGNGYDPIFQYALVGDTVEDGVFVWISVAVDMTAERDVTAVSTMTGSLATATKGDTSTAPRLTKYGGFAIVLTALTPMIVAFL